MSRIVHAPFISRLSRCLRIAVLLVLPAPLIGAGLADELQRGGAALRRTDWHTAREAFGAALGMDAASGPARAGLAEALIATGEFEEAARVLLPAGPEAGDLGLLLLRARLHRLRGDWTAAAADLGAGDRLAPEDSGLALERALLAADRGDAESAKGTLEWLVGFYRDAGSADARLYKHTGIACVLLGRLEDAENLLAWSLDEDEAQPEVHAWLAEVGLLRKDLFQAREDLGEAERRAPYLDRTHLVTARLALHHPGGEQGQAEALEALEAVLETDPGHADALALKAGILLDQGKLDAALAASEKALARNPRHREAWVRKLAAVYRAEGDEAYAAALARAVEQLGPAPGAEGAAGPASTREALEKAVTALLGEAGATLLRRGESLLAGGRYAEAVEHFRGMWTSGRRDPKVALAWAGALSARGEYAKALEKALTVAGGVGEDQSPAAPDPALRGEASLLAGDCLMVLGRFEEAEPRFRAAEEAGAGPAARWGRARVRLATGRRTDAAVDLEAIQASLRIEDQSGREAATLLTLAGRAAEAQARVVEASKRYVDAVKADREYQPAYEALGRLYLAKLQFDDARSIFQKLLAINPHSPEGHLGLAGVYLYAFQLGNERYVKAHQEVEAALAACPGHPGARILEAELLFDDGNAAGARARLEEVLEFNPWEPQALGTLAALAMIESPDSDAVFRELEARALEKNPRNAPFYYHAAEVLDDRFRYEDSRVMAARAVELDPEFWDAYHTLGLNLGRTGREREALEVLEKVQRVDDFNVWTNNTVTVLRFVLKDMKTLETEHFIIRMHADEADALGPWLGGLLEDAWADMEKRYAVQLQGPVLVEVFKNHDDFSARSIGTPFIGALGVCFGRFMTILSPNCEAVKDRYNWGETALHEFAHVVTLQKTGHRIPRWLTEGISVWEESQAWPGWDRPNDPAFLAAFKQQRLLPISIFDQGFVRPKSPDQVALSYAQGGVTVAYVVERWGWDKLVAVLDGYRGGGKTADLLGGVLGVTPEAFDAGFQGFTATMFQGVHWVPPGTQKSLELAKKAVEEKPDEVSAMVRLARAYLDLGRRADAETWAGRASRADSTHGDAQLIIGLLKLAQGQREAGKEALQRALILGTTDPFAVHLQLAQLALAAKDEEDAIAHFEKCRELFPGNPDLPRTLSKLYRKSGNTGKLAGALAELVALDRNDSGARLALAKLKREAGETASVAELLEQAAWIQPYDAAMLLELGEAALALERFATAERAFRSAIALKPEKLLDCRLGLAGALLGLGRREEAAAEARAVLETDAGNLRAKAVVESAERR